MRRLREYIVLEYLDDKMEATARMIGEAIVRATNSKSTNYSAIAARTIGKLRRKQWIMRVRELHAWQITITGRTELRGHNAY